VLKPFVRISSFLGKEIREILRQPWLVVRLILGPFLILLLVGLGFNNQARVMRALFVIPANEPQVGPTVEQYATNLGPQLQYMGETTNRDEAFQRLRNGQVDLVVVYPPHAYQTVKDGSQATLELYHNEIDPTQAAYVDQLGRVYVAELNRRILMQFAAQAKDQSSQANGNLQEARSAADSARSAAAAGDQARAQQELARASSSLDQATALLGAASLIMGGMGQGLGSGAPQPQLLPDTGGDQASVDTRTQQVSSNLDRLDQQMAEFQNVPPDVMVSPLATETKSIAPFTPSFVIFYAPGVLALILQHVAVSIASLALVREKVFGAVELFRVAPIRAVEIMIGKYGSYLLFVGVLGAILTALMIYLLGVPLLGQVSWLVLALVLLIFASLGYGFAISATSGTDSQAVQASMLLLLASMFFSGFVFALVQILVPVRYIGYLLPVTYGIISLQDIMLKGVPPPWYYLAALGGMGVLLFVFSWWRYRRSMLKA
jgi:ABC-2 type transport system permease protein